MATLLMARSALRRNIVPMSLGLTASLMMASRQSPMRFDSRIPPATSRPVSSGPKENLNPDLIKQLSSGSISGFVVGVVISLFSKTLVFLGGVGIVAIEIASRYGINLVDTLKLRKQIDSSKVLRSLNNNPVFKLSFGVTFALAAFASF